MMLLKPRFEDMIAKRRAAYDSKLENRLQTERFGSLPDEPPGLHRPLFLAYLDPFSRP